MSKRYTDEFKQNILELHQKGIKTARELSNEYGVGILRFTNGYEQRRHIRLPM